MESGETNNDAVWDRRLEFNGSLGTDYPQRDDYVAYWRDLGRSGQSSHRLDSNERDDYNGTSWSGTRMVEQSGKLAYNSTYCYTTFKFRYRNPNSPNWQHTGERYEFNCSDARNKS